jgi:hypothetical protein
MRLVSQSIQVKGVAMASAIGDSGHMAPGSDVPRCEPTLKSAVSEAQNTSCTHSRAAIALSE